MKYRKTQVATAAARDLSRATTHKSIQTANSKTFYYKIKLNWPNIYHLKLHELFINVTTYSSQHVARCPHHVSATCAIQ